MRAVGSDVPKENRHDTIISVGISSSAPLLCHSFFCTGCSGLANSFNGLEFGEDEELKDYENADFEEPEKHYKFYRVEDGKMIKVEE